MPFKSKSQWRACWAKNDPNWDCREFAHATDVPFKKLPKKVKKETSKEAKLASTAFNYVKDYLRENHA